MFILWFLIGCTQPIPVSNCDAGFRNQWWLLDPDVTDSLGATNDICIWVGDEGARLETYYEAWGPYEWDCIDTDTYRIHSQGIISTTRLKEGYRLDINYHGVIDKQLHATDCWFNYSF